MSLRDRTLDPYTLSSTLPRPQCSTLPNMVTWSRAEGEAKALQPKPEEDSGLRPVERSSDLDGMIRDLNTEEEIILCQSYSLLILQLQQLKPCCTISTPSETSMAATKTINLLYKPILQLLQL